MRLLSLLVCSIGLPLSAVAQDWKALQAEASANKSFSESSEAVLLDSTSVEVSDLGSGKFVIRRVVQINNENGALSNRVIKYDYDPLTAFAEFAEMKVYHPDGTVTDMDIAKACDYAAPARAIYWGARQIMMEPGMLEPGDVVDYTIHKKGFTYALLASDVNDDERFVPPMRGEFYDIVPFWVSSPTVHKVYRVSVPREKDVQYEFFQGDCGSSVKFDGDRRVYTFTVDNAVPTVSEPNMVDLYDVAPKLMMSSTPDWTEKSLWFNKVNEDYGSFDPTPEAQKKVDELLRGKTDEMERIAILTHWVADNMRYSGISMGKGEGYTLHNTQTNFTDRAGVCKDKAALLISMLRMAGFEAYPAMTMAGSRIEKIPADHFNHCVAVVKLSNGQYMPLDPTWVPFNRELWSSAEQQQNYLPGVPEGSDLLLTPVSAPENHFFKLTANTRLLPDGTLEGEVTVNAEGQSDAAVRRPFLQSFVERVGRSLEAELQRVSPQAKLSGYSCPDAKDYQKGPVVLKMKFTIPDYAVAGDGVMICRPFVLSNLYSGVKSFMRINTSKESRDYGFKDSCSRLVELKETMTLPKGYTMDGVSGTGNNVNVDSDIASFSSSVSGADNKVTIDARLSLGKRVYEAGEWSDFRCAVNAYKDLADSEFVIVKK
ncbi:MAG: DUF3857 and transglutaminase domain-containing protein [Muribaculaceae bacterium]|nr:DUF3857 and transglutaminase domain-containing protein [Muribaculaceae bacterium]